LLDHPNIVKLYEIYQDQKNIYLITEYLEGGELFDLILKTKHFNENIAAKIMKQLLSAVSYCHNKNIVHRDLKPENLLLCKPDSFEIKVIDFGLSRTF
jgi:calcium-dependent protein kinase